MFKLLTTICIFLALSAVHSQSCTDSSQLRAAYGLSSLNTPKSYSDIQYCKSIKNGNVCCPDTDINGFQNKANTILNNLSSMAATRDEYLSNVINNQLYYIQQNLNSFSAFVKTLSSDSDFGSLLLGGGMGSDDTDVDSQDSGSDDGTSTFSDISELLTSFGASINGSVASIKSDYVSFQKARSTCFVELVKLQMSAYCLACDPNAGSKGLYGLTFDTSDRVKSRLSNACLPYLKAAGTQDVIINLSYFAPMLNAAAILVNALSKSGQAAYEDPTVQANFENALAAAKPPASVIVGPAMPVCDTDDDCNLFLSGAIINGVTLDQTLMVLGGEPFELDGGERRMLSQIRFKTYKDSQNRRLSGSFDPDDDEAGVTVTFSNDPGNTNAPKFGSLSFGNVVFSMMIVILSILLL